MDFGFLARQLRGFHAPVRRLAAGAAAAAVFVLAVPAPAAAAPTPSVTITDVTVTEGNAGTVSASFTIQAAPRPRSPLQVTWATAPGSATSPADFTTSSGTVSLTKTSSSRIVTVPVVGDVIDEPNETFVVNLTNLVGSPGRIGDAQGLATVTDDDPLPALSVNDVTVTEGDAGTTTATFNVTLSAASAKAVTLDWATSAGSATAGTDYVTASGSRTISAGSTGTTIAITANGDTVDENNESFNLTLSNPGNATISDGSGLATITDDDPLPALSVNDVTVTEGDAGTTTATFNVTLSAASAKAVTLDWATSAGSATAGTDYVTSSGSRTIAAGATSTTIAITVNGDTVDENNESFNITLSNPGNATISDGSGVGTISDDDLPPTLSVNDVSVTEGNAGSTTATFNVTLSSASGKTITVDWATSAGSATKPGDYVAGSGTLTFVPSDANETIAVTVNGDVLDEVNESFDITLSNPGNATISDGSGVGTITDDDQPPTVSVDDVTVTEGDAGTSTATFNVTLSAASAKAVTLDWTTVDGSATQPADFTADSGTLTFVPGDTTEAVPVTLKGDVLDEVNESFDITLSNPGNATIADGSGLATITDDDPLPNLAIADASLPEGHVGTANAQFDVTLSAASAKTVTVDWTTVDDSAVQPADFTATSGTLTFAAGDTTGSILIPVIGDGIAELDESFLVSLTAPSNAGLADAEGVGTIVDDELLPVIDIDEPTVAEGQSGTGPVSFSVTLSHPAAWPVSVDWSTSDGTAGGGSDYVNQSGTVTFAPLDTSETVQVTVNGDGTFERDETVALDLSNATGAPIGDVQGIATITNDDVEPTVSLADVSAAEGNAGTSDLGFVVSLSAVSGVDASIDFATADGTATGGSDYVAATGSLTIPAGETTGVVDVAVKGDVAYEGNESLSVSLSSPTDAVVGDAVAQGTITNDDKAPTTATLRTVKKPRTLLAKGILEPAKSGDRVTATLFRKRNGRFVRVAAKSVPVRSLRDRDGDGKTDGAYTAKFVRPKAGGTYRILVRCKGNSTEKACTRAKLFKLRRT